MTQQLPWDFCPSLIPDRLNHVASILAETRDTEVNITHDPDDIHWALGCLVYNRTLVALRKDAKQTEWLSVLPGNGTALTGTIGSVPFKIYKGKPAKPTDRTLAIRHDELRQMALAELDLNSSEVDLWRFAVDANPDGTTQGVHFVGFNEAGDVLCQWECSPKGQSGTVTSFPTPPANFPKEQAKKLDLPPILPKEHGKKDARNE